MHLGAPISDRSTIPPGISRYLELINATLPACVSSQYASNIKKSGVTMQMIKGLVSTHLDLWNGRRRLALLFSCRRPWNYGNAPVWKGVDLQKLVSVIFNVLGIQFLEVGCPLLRRHLPAKGLDNRDTKP